MLNISFLWPFLVTRAVSVRSHSKKQKPLWVSQTEEIQCKRLVTEVIEELRSQIRYWGNPEVRKSRKLLPLVWWIGCRGDRVLRSSETGLSRRSWKLQVAVLQDLKYRRMITPWELVLWTNSYCQRYHQVREREGKILWLLLFSHPPHIPAKLPIC